VIFLNTASRKFEDFQGPLVQFRKGLPDLCRPDLDGAGSEGYPVKLLPISEKGLIPMAPDVIKDLSDSDLECPVAGPAPDLDPVKDLLETPV